MFWAVVVLAVIASERKVHFNAACGALRRLRLPGWCKYAPTPSFNLGTHNALTVVDDAKLLGVRKRVLKT
jgi:hypothetical protein